MLSTVAERLCNGAKFNLCKMSNFCKRGKGGYFNHFLKLFGNTQNSIHRVCCKTYVCKVDHFVQILSYFLKFLIDLELFLRTKVQLKTTKATQNTWNYIGFNQNAQLEPQAKQPREKHKELKICQTFLFPEQSVMTQSRDKTVK